MGLKNSQEFLVRLTRRMLSDLEFKCILQYSDDGLVFSSTWEDHMAHLREVFTRYRKFKLSLKGKKCSFAVNKVPFCGMLVDADGVHPDPRHVEAIMALSLIHI